MNTGIDDTFLTGPLLTDHCAEDVESSDGGDLHQSSGEQSSSGLLGSSSMSREDEQCLSLPFNSLLIGTYRHGAERLDAFAQCIVANVSVIYRKISGIPRVFSQQSVVDDPDLWYLFFMSLFKSLTSSGVFTLLKADFSDGLALDHKLPRVGYLSEFFSITVILMVNFSYRLSARAIKQGTNQAISDRRGENCVPNTLWLPYLGLSLCNRMIEGLITYVITLCSLEEVGYLRSYKRALSVICGLIKARAPDKNSVLYHWNGQYPPFFIGDNGKVLIIHRDFDCIEGDNDLYAIQRNGNNQPPNCPSLIYRGGGCSQWAASIVKGWMSVTGSSILQAVAYVQSELLSVKNSWGLVLTHAIPRSINKAELAVSLLVFIKKLMYVIKTHCLNIKGRYVVKPATKIQLLTEGFLVVCLMETAFCLLVRQSIMKPKLISNSYLRFTTIMRNSLCVILMLLEAVLLSLYSLQAQLNLFAKYQEDCYHLPDALAKAYPILIFIFNFIYVATEGISPLEASRRRRTSEQNRFCAIGGKWIKAGFNFEDSGDALGQQFRLFQGVESALDGNSGSEIARFPYSLSYLVGDQCVSGDDGRRRSCTF